METPLLGSCSCRDAVYSRPPPTAGVARRPTPAYDSCVLGRDSAMGATLHQLLKTLVERGGSDLHITTNSPPMIRVDGDLIPLDYPPLTVPETKQLAYSILTDVQKHRFEEQLELDLSFGVKGLARFRGNCFLQRGAVSAVFRQIPYEILGFRELGIPNIVEGLCNKPRGLV